MAAEGGFLRRLRERIGAARVAQAAFRADERAEPAVADAGLPSLSSRPVVMVTVVGVEADLVEEILDVTSAKFARRHRLVFLTDSAEFGAFRRAGVVFEYVPSLLQQRLHADVMDWPAYLTERWALLLAKWRPVHIVAYGRNMPAFLAESAAIPAARPLTSDRI